MLTTQASSTDDVIRTHEIKKLRTCQKRTLDSYRSNADDAIFLVSLIMTIEVPPISCGWILGDMTYGEIFSHDPAR